MISSKSIAVVLCLLSPVLAVAETNDLAIAREALRDGLWEVARLHAGRDGSDDGRLVILESFAGEGKWQDVEKTLAGWADRRGEGFDYYRAVVKGDLAAATELLRKGGSREGLVEADLHEADALVQAGRRVEAEGIWRRLAASTNLGARVFVLASVNLPDVELLRRAYAAADTVSLRRLAGLRLGVRLLDDRATAEEGEKLVRLVVRDSPDASGAKEAFLAVADAQLSSARWKETLEAYREAIEVWPEVARLASVQEGRAWALKGLGRSDEALEAFKRAGKAAADDETKARTLVAVGDILRSLGREEESLANYRQVMVSFAETSVAKNLKDVIAVRELEKTGRDLYRQYRYAEAAEAFSKVAKADAQRRPAMEFFGALCLFGEGRDDEACVRMKALSDGCSEREVRREALLWLAKFRYNRREFDEAQKLFMSGAEEMKTGERAAEALLWAARAAFAGDDANRAIQLGTLVAERYPDSKAKPLALLLQGEVLIEQGRFAEAVLVFDRVATTGAVPAADVRRAQLLKADALFALGADNPARYQTALESYRTIRFGESLSESDQIVVSAKIARCLEKLRKLDEAVDVCYTQVVLAYRNGRQSGIRYSDEARAAFSRAALRLAEEYESRGKNLQAVNILRLVEASDVPAAAEASRRLERISRKGGLL